MYLFAGKSFHFSCKDSMG